MPYFGGLDWGGAGHAVCVVDATGAVLLSLEIRHDAAGLAELRRRLAKLAPAGALPIAIERPTGLIVDALVEAGHPVVPIHPNVVKACRPRYRAAGGKSDPGDAFMLADILAHRGHRFRPLRPCSDEIKALRALVRGRDDLVAERVCLANRLRSLLGRLLARRRRHLRRHRLADRAGLRTALSDAGGGRTPRREADEGLPREPLLLRPPHSGRAARPPARRTDRPGRRGRSRGQGRDGPRPRRRARAPGRRDRQADRPYRAGRRRRARRPDRHVLPARRAHLRRQILAELGDVRERFPTADQLAAEAGVSPVTHASGKSRGVVFRWACNHRLRAAITCFADNSRHASPWAADVYKRARHRGCDHPHAIRILARAWIRVLWRAWTDGALYDPARHNAAVAQNALAA